VEDDHRRDEPARDVPETWDDAEQRIEANAPPSAERDQPIEQPRELLDPFFTGYLAR
jgi:hypothetical protein